MYNFTKGDLKLTHYTSTASKTGDDPSKRKVDRNKFNKNQDYEVVDMINQILEKLFLEKMINNPEEAKAIGNDIELIIKNDKDIDNENRKDAYKKIYIRILAKRLLK
ncbi:MAG: hypothetical protein ACOCWG_06025 [bacterium]